MECSPKKDFGLFGSTFFFGCVVSSFILPRLSDVYGRKPIALLGNVLHVIAGTIIVTTKGVNVSLLFIFI